MKNYKLLLSLIACGAMMLFNSAASAADDTKVGVVTVLSIRGQGEYSMDGGHAWTPLVVGKNLPPGSIIHSGVDSIIDILIGKSQADKNLEKLQVNTSKNPALNVLPQIERNMVRMRPDTTLGVDKLVVPAGDPTVISDCQLDLKKGKIFASIKKVTPSSEYFIKLPSGVAAVRGTQIELSTDGTSSGSFCAVVSGTVWLSFSIIGADGEPVLAPNGQPLAPVQITLNPGQSFSLTSILINTLIQQAKSAPASATPAEIALTLIAAATSGGITDISPSELNTLVTVFQALVNPTVQTIAVTITTQDHVTNP